MLFTSFIQRENDNLNESQIEISKLVGFRQKDFQRPVERFMKRYYIAAKNIGSLTRSFSSEDKFKKSIRFNFFPQWCKSRKAIYI